MPNVSNVQHFLDVYNIHMIWPNFSEIQASGESCNFEKAQFSKKIDLHSEIFHRKVKRSKLYSLFVCRARRRRWLVEYLLLEKF